jgi:hypothetical protein
LVHSGRREIAFASPGWPHASAPRPSWPATPPPSPSCTACHAG